ncbi:hypothetical protein ACQUFH_12690 [Lactococcus lactis]|uniref:hypothetical protein n=1 Tax=Lactococcus TaxID=1357 RepID=UPI003241D972
MEIKFQVDDEIATNMTQGAINGLVKQSEAYAIKIIKEAGRVEESYREDGAQIEITENTIFQAVRKNKTLVNKKNRKVSYIKLGSELTLFLSGLIFNQKMFAESMIYLIGYFLLITVAIILTVITYVKDDE